MSETSMPPSEDTLRMIDEAVSPGDHRQLREAILEFHPESETMVRSGIELLLLERSPAARRAGLQAVDREIGEAAQLLVQALQDLRQSED